jgi:hypothetical protein
VLAALALALVATVAGGVVAAQPAWADSWHYPNPSIAANAAGNQWVFWKGTNGGLWEAAYYGGSWHGPTGIGQMGTLGSPPTVAVIGPNVYVVWEGTDGHLWLGYWSNGWHGPYNLGMGKLGSRPAISADQQNVLTVVWKGNDGNLWYAYSPQNPGASGWSGPHNLGHGTLGSSPSVTGSVGGQYLDAGWVGSGSSKDLWWRQGNGIFKDLGLGPLNSPPSLVYYATDRWQGFWAGTDGALWTAQWSYSVTGGTGVDATGRLGLGPLGSAPSAAFPLNGNTIYVVWQGTDNNLWETTCNASSCWGGPHQVPGMGPL